MNRGVGREEERKGRQQLNVNWIKSLNAMDPRLICKTEV